MGEGGLERMGDCKRFGGIQRTNYGRTLGVFCQHLTLALGGLECVRRIQV